MNKTRFLYITVMLTLADINSWYINPVSTHPHHPPPGTHTHTHTPSTSKPFTLWAPNLATFPKNYLRTFWTRRDVSVWIGRYHGSGVLYITVMLILADINSWYINPVKDVLIFMAP